MPEAPVTTAKSAAKACARIAPDRHAVEVHWRERAEEGDFEQVHSPPSCYVRALDDPGGAAQPRREPGYAEAVMKELGFDDKLGFGHLSDADYAAVKEVFGRKTEAFWVKGTTRTLVRGFVHDALTVGNPVRGHPIRLKGAQADFVADSLSKAAAEGLYRRGSSPWGSWAFSTEETSKRPARVVVDYRQMNRRLVRARYFLRHMDDIKIRLAMSLWYTLGDGAKGFNQLEFTARASMVYAVLSEIGQFLPACLQLGPENGPEDFQYVFDEVYTLSPMHAVRLNKVWENFVDD